MTKLLIRLFVRNWENTDSPAVRESYGKLAGITGVVTNLLLALLKLLSGWFFNSIAIMADAVNNLSDSASSIVTLVGFKLSSKPADAKHPYGHARIEYISGMIVSFIVVVLGVQLAQSSIDKILAPEESSFTWITIGVLVVSILLKLWQGLFYRKIGKTISSTTLEATSTDSLNDVISTSAVLAGIIITLLTGVNLDGWLGLLVAVLITISGIRLVMETSQPLLGMAPSQELVQSIYSRILSYDGIIGLHDLEVHSYGEGRIFASVHCEVDADQDIMISHDIIDNIERDFLQDSGIHLVIHLDPVQIHDDRTQKLYHQVREMVAQLSPEYSIHDFRVVWGTTHSNLIFDMVVPYGLSQSDEEVARAMGQLIQERLGKNYFAVVTIDHDYIGSGKAAIEQLSQKSRRKNRKKLK
ncbi:MAG TPA: cation diffusion facilitator family transporter [Firmicutes bacterium]|nr:cation diffusion facilitator family transporter [Bacillota bacterium]